MTQLLTRLNGDTELVGRAMVFLLKNKDRYGVWHSTQTTINVLDTFLTALAAENTQTTQQLEILVNGLEKYPAFHHVMSGWGDRTKSDSTS